MDALHLGYLGGYGNDWIDTPALDELAARGVVFDQHISDQPDATGARRAWRSGRYSPPADAAAAPRATDLLALFRSQGVRTSLVIDGSRPHVAAFAEGWDHAAVVSPKGDGTPMELTLDAVQSALDRHVGDKDWLIWLELATLRPPWDVPEDFSKRYFETQAEEEEDEDEDEGDEDEAIEENEPAETADAKAPSELTPFNDPEEGPIDPADDLTFQRLQRTYAGAVAYLDAGLGLLLQDLDERGLLEDLAIVLTSDHGLPLGEHGVVGLARPWLHDELIHVPLLLRLPGAAEAGRRIAALTQPVDLTPTLLDLFGVPVPPMHGHSLLPLARGNVEQLRDYAFTALRVGEREEVALRTPEWAFVLPTRLEVEDTPRLPQLFVKPDDRWEVNDLRQHHLEWAEQLEPVLRAILAATQKEGTLVLPPLPEEEAPQENA